VSETPETEGGFRLWMLFPVAGAAAVLAVFLLGLQRDDGGRNLPSPLIDKPAPEFALPPLRADAPGLSTADLKAPGSSWSTSGQAGACPAGSSIRS
jgi:cytochrome c biogenesis protein CcmG/thiol:disulfide interchange protein DsbE